MTRQCRIEGCTNVIEIPSKNQGILFNALQKDVTIRKALKNNTLMNQYEWAVCTEHYTADIPIMQKVYKIKPVGGPVPQKICRICLVTDMKLLSISKYKLDTAYEELTGVCLDEDTLPKYLCVECAQRLINCSRFRQKSFEAYLLLIEIADNDEHGKFTLPTDRVLKRKRTQKNLTSSLGKKIFETNHFDILFNTQPNLLLKTEDKKEYHERSIEKEIKYKSEIDMEDKNKNESFTKMKDEFNNDDDDFVDFDGDNALLIVNIPENHDFIESTREEKKKAVKKKSGGKKEPKIPKPTGRMASSAILEELNSFSVSIMSFEEQIAEIQARQETSEYINALFKCNLCFRGFKIKETYDNHMQRHSDVCGEFECPVCHLRFDTQRHLRAHGSNMHKQRFSCKECDFVSVFRRLAILHARKHKGVRYKCSKCDAVFSSLTTKLNHVRIKHPSDYVCEQCGYSFLGEKGVTHHKRKVHRLNMKEIPEDGPFCEQCNICFVSEEALSKHLGVSPKHTTHSSYNQKQHKYAYKKRIPIPWENRACEHCGEELTSSRMYYRHLHKKHNLTFDRKHNLKKYYVMCESCGKQFPSSTALRDHAWVHTGEKAYKCEKCGKLYACKIALKTHDMKSHLGIVSMFPCKICDRQFSQIANRNRHMKFFHTDYRPFKCEICEKTYKSRTDLQLHVKCVHLNHPWPKRSRGKEQRTVNS